MDDLNSKADWTEVVATQGNGAFSVTNNDYFDLENTGGAVDYSVWNNTPGAMGISSDTYPFFLVRYKCSNASVKAQVELTFAAGSQVILAEDNSTTWKVASGTVTASKTINYVELFANDAAGHVYYDFTLICKGQFTIPNVPGTVGLNLEPREAFLPIPGRDVDLTQNLGSQAIINMNGLDLTAGDWTRTGDNVDGEVFMDILHNRSNEPWQWLDMEDPTIQMKVSVHPQWHWALSGEETARTINLVLREYSLGDKGEESYVERWALDQ